MQLKLIYKFLLNDRFCVLLNKLNGFREKKASLKLLINIIHYLQQQMKKAPKQIFIDLEYALNIEKIEIFV